MRLLHWTAPNEIAQLNRLQSFISRQKQRSICMLYVYPAFAGLEGPLTHVLALSEGSLWFGTRGTGSLRGRCMDRRSLAFNLSEI